MDKMREDFEAWAKGQFGLYRLGSVEGFYSCDRVQDAWFAWQAAWSSGRGSIVVTLPDSHNGYLDKQVVQHALDEAGVSYK